MKDLKDLKFLLSRVGSYGLYVLIRGFLGGFNSYIYMKKFSNEPLVFLESIT